MPFCKYCGSEHDADAFFCTECGKPIVKKAVPVAENVPQVTPPVATPAPVTETAQEITPPVATPAPVSDPPAQAAPTASNPPKKKKSKKAVWIIGVAVACVAVIAAVLILPLIWGIDGVWISIVVAEIMAVVFSAIFLVIKKKMYHY